MAEILKSNFFSNLEDIFIDHEFYEGSIFGDENKINEFLDNIIFLPFYSRDLGISGFTFYGDLKILISGYPYMNNTNFANYKIHKILNLSLLIIILLHESIHYAKRKLFYLTCGIISRETFLNGEKMEGGNLLEKLIFGWGDEDEDENADYYNKNKILKAKKLNIEIALKILNPNTYKNNIKEVKDIFNNHRKPEIFADLLTKFLAENDLKDEKELNEFIKENENVTINAKRDFDEEPYVEYIQSDHRNNRI